MNEHEHEAVVAGLPPMLRKIYEVIKLGPTTARMLREPTGRIDGMTTELRRLQALGLIRTAGRVPRSEATGGIRAMRYVAVPPTEVEREREAFASRRQPKKRRAPASRMHEHRAREKGEFGDWYRTRRRVLELTQVLSLQLPKMADWEAAPEDELALVAEELADLHEAVELCLYRLKLRQADDKTRAKIDKLLETKGRTPEEVETAERLAKRLGTRVGLD